MQVCKQSHKDRLENISLDRCYRTSLVSLWQESLQVITCKIMATTYRTIKMSMLFLRPRCCASLNDFRGNTTSQGVSRREGNFPNDLEIFPTGALSMIHIPQEISRSHLRMRTGRCIMPWTIGFGNHSPISEGDGEVDTACEHWGPGTSTS